MNILLLTLGSLGCAAGDSAAGNDYSVNGVGAPLFDVHGAGAQRSDPKTGDAADYAGGHGPQGDVVRIDNYVRCVRGSSEVLPDTNQDDCWGAGTGEEDCAGTGQDGEYVGQGPDYSVDGGVVTDEVSGLMWTAATDFSTFGEAEELAAGLGTGGYDDWRLPTVSELYTLIDFSGSTGTAAPESQSAPDDAVPYVDDSVFDFEYATDGRYIDVQYLSSTEYVSQVTLGEEQGPVDAFMGVNFADGRIKGYPLSGAGGASEYEVWFVRGEQVELAFSDNGDATVIDDNTGLMWMQEDSGAGMDWLDALEHCEGMDLAGFDDWRLPDAHELQSIVDYSRSPDTTDSAALHPVFESTPIVDEEGDLDWPFYWSSTTHKDGIEQWDWAVYVSFGEAKGYGP
jgi:hypothetical protein